MPFECDIDLNVPEGAMHSFAADHNEIAWTLVVEGDVAGWPEYRRAFPVIIRPASGRTQPMSEEPTVVIRLDGDCRVVPAGRNAFAASTGASRSPPDRSRRSRSPCFGIPRERATRTWPFTSFGGASSTDDQADRSSAARAVLDDVAQ